MRNWVTCIAAVVLLVMTAAAQEVPRYEVNLGYDLVRFNSVTNGPAFNANGGSAQFAYNFNRWFAGVVDAGAVHNGNIRDTQLDGTLVNYLGGPRVTIRRWRRATPYLQALFGGVYATTSVAAPLELLGENGVVPPTGSSFRATREETAFGMTAGGGLDIKISRHVSFRPIQVEYFLTRLRNLRTPNDNSQNNIRYSAGFTFLFGGENPAPPPPPPPSTRTCPDGSIVPANGACPKHDLTLALKASASQVCPGDVAQVTPAVSGASANQLNYQWTVNGQPISQGQNLVFGSTGREPGAYNVGLSVSGANFNPAAASTSITVLQYLQPTGTAQADPMRIYVGEKSALSANFTGQCGGPIQAPTFTASEGSVQGDQFTCDGVQFDAANNAEQEKTITITAHAADKLNVGTATTTVVCVKKATIAAIRLPDIMFSQNNARVNNCGKRILLEQLRGYLDKDPTGTVVLVGNASDKEKAGKIDMQRALNAAAVITAGKGVCLSVPQSQVLVSATGVNQNGVSFDPGMCGPSVGAKASPMQRVQVWFVPTGGQLPPSLTQYEKASTLSLGGLGCPK